MAKRRKIIKIDEEKCDGCGQCIPACAEGAIQIIGGKARLVSEVYCDGLGDCLGECPQGAISIEEREAEDFDPEAARHHLAHQTAGKTATVASSQGETDSLPCGCPGGASRLLQRESSDETSTARDGRTPIQSLLGNWPVQIHLVPINAPYFEDATLLVAADCVPFAFGDFHRRFLPGRTLLVGCPKLDDADFYRQKLARIFRENTIQSVEVAYMEVPCCMGLVHIVRLALDDSGKKIPLMVTKVGISGLICESGAEQD